MTLDAYSAALKSWELSCEVFSALVSAICWIEEACVYAAADVTDPLIAR